jgi:hypothetical protein
MIQTYKFINGVGGLNCEGLLTKVDTGENRRTRQSAGKDNLRRQVARTEIRKNSFAVRVVSKWNSLPDNIKESRSVEEFKKKLKIHTRMVGGIQGARF